MNHEFVFEPVVQFAVSVFENRHVVFDFSSKKCPEQKQLRIAKDQLISKCLFGVFKLTKKPTKIL